MVVQDHVVDFSLMKLSCVDDILELRKDDEGRSKSKRVTTVRMSSNTLTTLDSLLDSLLHFVQSRDQIKFMDFSINKIQETTHFSQFKNVTCLYLHANNIKTFKSIKPLSTLNLKSLTLHGNPIEEHKHYRNYVLHLFPKLVKLDFALVIKRDRERCKTWEKIFRNKLNGKNKH